MHFNIRLKELRQARKITQGKLADLLGLKPTAISNYEAKRNEPSFDKLIAISKYFDVSCDYLLGVTDTYFPISQEVKDKDTVDFLNNYQKLNTNNLKELKNYIDYLIYKQERE